MHGALTGSNHRVRVIENCNPNLFRAEIEHAREPAILRGMSIGKVRKLELCAGNKLVKRCSSVFANLDPRARCGERRQQSEWECPGGDARS
eukprot:765503-Hanusia_phi.AAC.12